MDDNLTPLDEAELEMWLTIFIGKIMQAETDGDIQGSARAAAESAAEQASEAIRAYRDHFPGCAFEDDED